METRQDTLNDLIAMTREFCEQRDWDQFHAPDQLAVGIVTEAAELLQLFRFKSPEQLQALLDSPQGRERVSDELADVFFFVLRFAQMNHIDLPTAMRHKMAKNDLKYPVEKSRGRNLKYDELEQAP
ncbi:nucleotide pyrophosphohydrolase [Myxococcota bacterium]|nr:nucleotide pyrophosphohydrolase [Myxococcota bacterium]